MKNVREQAATLVALTLVLGPAAADGGPSLSSQVSMCWYLKRKKIQTKYSIQWKGKQLQQERIAAFFSPRF